jgi:hypothetical protein
MACFGWFCGMFDGLSVADRRQSRPFGWFFQAENMLGWW